MYKRMMQEEPISQELRLGNNRLEEGGSRQWGKVAARHGCGMGTILDVEPQPQAPNQSEN